MKINLHFSEGEAPCDMVEDYATETPSLPLKTFSIASERGVQLLPLREDLHVGRIRV